MSIRKLVQRNYCLLILSTFLSLLILLTGADSLAAETQNQPEAETNTATVSPDKKIVLPSSLAGSWYSADKKVLRKQLESFVEQAGLPIQDPNIIALIMPHAGYRFSGAVAMKGLQGIRPNKYRRIIVMGPSHRHPMENIMSVPNVTHYGTPLGEVPLDLEFIDKLKKHNLFQTIPPAHKREHSVQIEIPLLQYQCADFRLVPIVVGLLDRPTLKKAAAIIRALVDAETLVIASSDFTHYGPNYRYMPFQQDIPENIKKLDMGAYAFIEKCDAAGFLNYCQSKQATICGSMPIAVLLNMLPSNTSATLRNYNTSGKITGDFTNSVSYVSIAFTGKWAKGSPVKRQNTKKPLTENDKKELLKLARGSLMYFLENRTLATPEQLGVSITEPMKQVRATFVTLQKNHQLRGCIGEIYPSQPLYKSVLINAIKAGLADRRFPRVCSEECLELVMEISVLTPPHAASSYKDIILGQHGIVLNKDGCSAVFLPQVATEQGWNLEETLQHLSRKAGLATNAWEDKAQFMLFEAEVFGEKEV